MRRTADLNVVEFRALPRPEELLAAWPKTAAQVKFVHESRETVRRVLHGEDGRLLAIVGPCSIHDIEAGRDRLRHGVAIADACLDWVSTERWLREMHAALACHIGKSAAKIERAHVAHVGTPALV